MSTTERELQVKSLAHPCPECGAKPGKRCRTLSRTLHAPENGYHGRTKVDVRKYPHPKRVESAWREWLTEHYGAQT